MKTVETLKLLAVWVEPTHLVATARILMQGHSLKTLGVCDGGKLVGIVTAERLAARPDDAFVESAMEPATHVVQGTASIRSVAELFMESGIDSAPVLRGDRFVGVVTATMLLRELSLSWDPLTNLSWQDLLREWGVENLEQGHEVTVLFIDLDNFGLYNKRYGHTVGDKVLRQVASLLQSCIEPDRDVLVRYGGDEFAIGTLRNRSESEEFAAMIVRRMPDAFVDEAEEPVTACIGVCGGKRTKEREQAHYHSTLDNLINLASQDCNAKKRAQGQAKPALAPQPVVASREAVAERYPRVGHPDLNVVEVLVEETNPNSMTTVLLAAGEAIVSGVSARMGGLATKSVAAATAKAIERAYPGSFMRVDDLQLTDGGGGMRVATITAQVTDSGGSRQASGAAEVTADLYQGVAEATLQAFFSVR
ncbi:MAG: diguanylate cyclase [Fimbriimonas ginsengisoli]|uniref:Diguanylate cyclase n=1 Tax=Fimbriimonas ginsengisoli TaxID=1005039 RepID=A0A931LRE8_FIMGI|nr:diguanylate cyclase [Fimbriimonas ginsengisoli]